MNEKEFECQKDVIHQIIQKEIDKNNAIEAFRRIIPAIKKLVRCPVCGHLGYFEVKEGLGRWFSKCNNCQFDPGTAKSIEELLMRVLAFSEKEYPFWQNDKKTDNDEEDEEDEEDEPYEYP